MALLLAFRVPAAARQAAVQGEQGSLVIVVGQEASAPIPTIIGSRADADVADLVFLHLARLGPKMETAGDDGFVPELASRWIRRDSVTLAFDLDPRARWHDGRPVTARDVAFTFNRYRDTTFSTQYSVILRHIRSVTAEGDRRVVIRFSQVYSEQLYDAAYHMQPLPAHLVDTIPQERLALSAFARAPVGNGPYRWGRKESGRLIELTANPQFFLGAPKITRVVFLRAPDPEAQMSLLLDGTADAHQAISPVTGVPRMLARKEFVIRPVPSLTVGYLTFNLRASGDRTQPHPILADPDVRRALAMAVDRRTLVRVAFGDYGRVPEGPVAQTQWFGVTGGRPVLPYDPEGARRLLAARGWVAGRGGVLEKNGVPLVLRLNYPGPNAARAAMAPLVQEELRQIGVRIELVRLEGAVWVDRRHHGEFDVDFSQASLDPSPANLNQSWSCRGVGGENAGGYCNPQVDTLIDRAIGRPGRDLAIWRQILTLIIRDAPAIFVYAPTNAMVLHRRYQNVIVRPTSYWADVWQWSVRPGQQISRDRGSGGG